MTLHSKNVALHVAIQRGDEAEAQKVWADVVDHINQLDWVYASVGKVTARVSRPMKETPRLLESVDLGGKP